MTKRSFAVWFEVNKLRNVIQRRTFGLVTDTYPERYPVEGVPCLASGSFSNSSRNDEGLLFNDPSFLGCLTHLCCFDSFQPILNLSWFLRKYGVNEDDIHFTVTGIRQMKNLVSQSMDSTLHLLCTTSYEDVFMFANHIGCEKIQEWLRISMDIDQNFAKYDIDNRLHCDFPLVERNEFFK